jgi:hypothetical protein
MRGRAPVLGDQRSGVDRNRSGLPSGDAIRHPAAESRRDPDRPCDRWLHPAAPAAAPGNPAAHDRINSLTDCAALQAEFDTASASFDRVAKGTAESAAAIGFMTAADARMKQVGCY